MSGLDPLAALAAQAVANAQAAMDEAILSLGADVATLQAQVKVGDVIAATVLPPQGGTDLLSFLGQTVAAQIPPGINPGETLLLQVTGFTNSTVTVRNLGTIDPENPIPTVNPELTPPATDGPQTAVLSTQIAPAPSSPAPSVAVPLPSAALPSASVATALPPVVPPPSAATAPSVPIPANVAPPREVFVAASVRPNLAANARALAAQIEEVVASNDVEARLAANRASAPAPPAGPPAQASPAAQRGVSPPSAPSAAAPTAPPSSRFPVAPPIVQPASNLPASPQAQPLPAAVPRQGVPSTPEGELLTRLGVPITPATLAAARSVSTATQSVTAAYERLEGLLARIAPESAGALRSMLAFVARFDLRNSRALPEQIATFVSDVLDGAESKIVQSVAAWDTLAQTEPSAEPSPDAPAQTPAQLQAQTQAQSRRTAGDTGCSQRCGASRRARCGHGV